jgi:RNA polymerase sigma-70 factor (ECF subfamily)
MTTLLSTTSVATSSSAPTDAEVVDRVRAGHIDEFELLMRRYNRRVFRVVRGIVGNDSDAEDASQEAWLAAYRHLDTFEGRSAFTTWLTRIAMRKAIAHVRGGLPIQSLDDLDQVAVEPDSGPEVRMEHAELARRLEHAIDRLPPSYRLVLMLRDIEHLSTSEAANVLGEREENVRVRLHRARSTLRERLVADLGAASIEVFAFDGSRCDRMVKAVLGQFSLSANG